jgi:membrane-bound lytic murein transglycosylase MltF
MFAACRVALEDAQKPQSLRDLVTGQFPEERQAIDTVLEREVEWYKPVKRRSGLLNETNPFFNVT